MNSRPKFNFDEEMDSDNHEMTIAHKQISDEDDAD
jgi:hypothetical protein